MSHKTRPIAALAMVAIMLLATAGLGAATSPTVHTSGDGTVSDTSEITDGATITYNSSTNSTLTYRADSNNSSVTVLQNGTVLETFENGTDDEIAFVAHNATSGNDYLNFTLADDETGYPGIEAAPGENVTLTYRISNDTSLDNPDTTNVTVYWDNDGNLTFTRFDSDHVETADRGTLGALATSILYLSSNVSVDPAQAERESVSVNGDTQDAVTVHVADADAQDALSETHTLATDTGLSWMGTASIGGDAVPVLAAGEDGPDWLGDNQTYATVSESGGEVVVHNAGDSLASDDSEVTINTVGSEAAGFWYAQSLVRSYDGGLGAAVSAGSSAIDFNGSPGFGS